VRLPGDVVSIRVDQRGFLVTVLLVLLTLASGLVALGVGGIFINAIDVARVFLGQAEPAVRDLIIDWRLPRVAIGVLFGAALGISGAVFQSLLRNPLGSPDVIGFDAGAYSGALVTIIATGATAYVIPGSLVAGVVTAMAVYLLAWNRGVQGFRLIVVGIAVTAMLGSLNTYLILKADIYTAVLASIWGAGSLNGLEAPELRSGAIVIGLLCIPLVFFAPHLKLLEIGDDGARALGLRVELSRPLLIGLGVALSATVTALAGPIPFVALCAPQIAARLTRGPGPHLLSAAAVGAFLVVLCDVIAANAFPQILPVGLVTVSVGGLYLIWLVFRQVRRVPA